ncbi:MAG: class I SAM-dependent methyltransferase [Thermodesulfobacteriota bacterium]
MEKNDHRVTMAEHHLASLLVENTPLRLVEPGIYSVLPDSGSGNEYDTRFGIFYDRVACHPLYNRLIWGYAVALFPEMADEALRSSGEGNVLDLGCGSLAFTADVYSRWSGRPVVLADQSLKMLRMGKARIVGQRCRMPENLVFLQADALRLPFRENAFQAVLCQNLLHCLADTGPLLAGLEKILSENGRMYFTTLVKAGRLADRYLDALAKNGKLVARTASDHQAIFDRLGLPGEYAVAGNMLSIRLENGRTQSN